MVGARAGRPKDVCLERVRECQVYVGLIGHCYGYVPEDEAISITEAEYESAKLGYANANAQVVRAQTDLENARDRMTDTRIRAPLNGTIIQTIRGLGYMLTSGES